MKVGRVINKNCICYKLEFYLNTINWFNFIGLNSLSFLNLLDSYVISHFDVFSTFLFILFNLFELYFNHKTNSQWMDDSSDSPIQVSRQFCIRKEFILSFLLWYFFYLFFCFQIPKPCWLNPSILWFCWIDYKLFWQQEQQTVGKYLWDKDSKFTLQCRDRILVIFSVLKRWSFILKPWCNQKSK